MVTELVVNERERGCIKVGEREGEIGKNWERIGPLKLTSICVSSVLCNCFNIRILCSSRIHDHSVEEEWKVFGVVGICDPLTLGLGFLLRSCSLKSLLWFMVLKMGCLQKGRGWRQVKC